MTKHAPLIDQLAFSHVLTKRIHLELGTESVTGNLELTFTLDSGIAYEGDLVTFYLIVRTDSPHLVIDIEVHAIYESKVAIDTEKPEAWAAFRTLALPALREALLRVQDSALPMLVRGVEMVPPAHILRDAIGLRETAAQERQDLAQRHS